MRIKHLLVPFLLLVCVAALPFLAVYLHILDKWELAVFDSLCRRFHTEENQSDQIALILIDNSTLEWGEVYYKSYETFRKRGIIKDEDEAEVGGDRHYYKWPWKRTVYDTLIQYLAQGGARAVAFDLDFSSSQGDEDMESILGFSTQLQNEEGKTFVIHTLNFLATENPPVSQLTENEKKCLDAASIHVEATGTHRFPFDRSDSGYYYNPILPNEDMVPDALEGYLRLGAVCPQPDSDAVIRRARVLTAFENWTFPSLGLAAAAAFLESSKEGQPVKISTDDEGLVLDHPGLGKSRKIPLTPSGDVLIHWKDTGKESYEGEGRFRTYPAFQIILSAKNNPDLIEAMASDPAHFYVDPSTFKDKIVFIGASAAALYDLKATPISENYPGVKVHAALAENILDGDPLRRLGFFSRGLSASLLALLILLGSLYLKKAALKSLLAAALAGLYLSLVIFLFSSELIWMDAVVPVAGGLLAYTSGLTYNYFTEGRHKREITRMFQHFVPPAVVDRLVSRPDALNTRGERVEITSFFSDIKGFTSLSNTPEMRGNPERLTEHLNQYLTEMTGAIHDCGGTLDKYIGDAVVAFFGAPLPTENHALEACKAALACQRRLIDFNARAVEKGLPPLFTRIGLFSGEAMVGYVGSEHRLGYTAIGSTVNFGSRLEGVNKVYGTWILAGATTVHKAGDGVVSRFIDRVRVPGVEEHAPPLEIHQIMTLAGEMSEKDRELLSLFQRATEEYQGGEFQSALTLFRRCAEEFDDSPSRVFSERCLTLVREKPENWDGVWKISSK